MAASPLMALDGYVPKIVLLFRLLLWISLVVGIVLPNNGWQHNYEGSFIPGMNDRFSGVAGHANGMGAIASLAVLLELDQFLRNGTNRWLCILHIGLGSALLFVTQSKTALIACALCGVYLMVSRKSRFLPRGLKVPIVATAVLIGCVVAWSALSEWVLSNIDSLASLTGRVSLWRYYWELGLERPWFGYGASLWSELLQNMSFKFPWAAGNAHNQVLNSFLMAGMFGVGCLSAFVIALFRTRRRLDVKYRALFTACLAFMVIRSFAEAGFEPGDLSVAAMGQTVLVGFCLCRQRARSAAPPERCEQSAPGTES
jgi:O-antigen ligase